MPELICAAPFFGSRSGPSSPDADVMTVGTIFEERAVCPYAALDVLLCVRRRIACSAYPPYCTPGWEGGGGGGEIAGGTLPVRSPAQAGSGPELGHALVAVASERCFSVGAASH